MGVAGTTNIMKVHLVGHILVKGDGLSDLHATGNVCVCRGKKEMDMKFRDGDIAVIDRLSTDMIPRLKKSSGIITEATDHLEDLNILSMALDIPIIIGAAGATKILKSGTSITMDASNGMVYAGHNKIEFE